MAELTIHPLVGRDELEVRLRGSVRAGLDHAAASASFPTVLVERDIKEGNRGHCSAEAIPSNLRESACRRGEEPKAAVISVASSPVAAPNLEGYSVNVVIIIARCGAP